MFALKIESPSTKTSITFSSSASPNVICYSMPCPWFYLRVPTTAFPGKLLGKSFIVFLSEKAGGKLSKISCFSSPFGTSTRLLLSSPSPQTIFGAQVGETVRSLLTANHWFGPLWCLQVTISLLWWYCPEAQSKPCSLWAILNSCPSL